MGAARNISGLKPFQKGQSGNPGGCPKLPEHLRGIRSFTQNEIIKIISKYGRVTFAELMKALDDPELSVMDKAIAKLFQRSVKEADYGALTFLLDRAVGKPGQALIEDDEDSDRTKISKMSFQELLQVIKLQIPDMAETKAEA